MQQVIVSTFTLDELAEAIISKMPPPAEPISPVEAIEKPITQNELAEFLNVTKQTIINLKAKNKIPFIMVGSHPRYILKDVLKKLEKK